MLRKGRAAALVGAASGSNTAAVMIHRLNIRLYPHRRACIAQLGVLVGEPARLVKPLDDLSPPGQATT